MQIPKKNEVKFISAHWCSPSDFSFWLYLWLFTSPMSCVWPSNFWQHCLNHLHLPLQGVPVVFGSMGPLGLPGRHCSGFWENCWCVPLPLNHPFWSVPVYFRRYLVSDGLAVHFMGLGGCWGPLCVVSETLAPCMQGLERGL